MNQLNATWTRLKRLHLEAAESYYYFACTLSDLRLKNVLLDQADQHRSMLVRLNYLLPNASTFEFGIAKLNAPIKWLWRSFSALFTLGNKSEDIESLIQSEKKIWTACREFQENFQDLPEEVFRWITVHQQRSRESIDLLTSLTGNLILEQPVAS